MKNRIILFITIIVCFLLQCTVMDRISIGSITPNLLLILCVSTVSYKHLAEDSFVFLAYGCEVDEFGYMMCWNSSTSHP